MINQDVVDFKTNEKYDLIVSISTLEHVGWDEEPRDDKKISKALNPYPPWGWGVVPENSGIREILVIFTGIRPFWARRRRKFLGFLAA